MEVPSLWEPQGQPSNVLILSHLPVEVFHLEERQFLDHMRTFGEVISYEMDEPGLRARVVYALREEAVYALGNVHGRQMHSSLVIVQYAPDLHVPGPDTVHLRVPAMPRQFLVSPPASPPVGWEPGTEDPPVVDYALISALAALEPGTALTLVASEEDRPSITLQDFSEEEGPNRFFYPAPTHRPPLAGQLLRTTPMPASWLQPTRYDAR
eukprot:m.258755 g.258755  ORF g.258755 m.258755 type:complete len:210 (+) comp21787_c0_seq1:223-852(+)